MLCSDVLLTYRSTLLICFAFLIFFFLLTDILWFLFADCIIYILLFSPRKMIDVLFILRALHCVMNVVDSN